MSASSALHFEVDFDGAQFSRRGFVFVYVYTRDPEEGSSVFFISGFLWI